MASIYKRSGSKIWQCAYYVEDPETGESRQVRKSTGKTTEREAKAAAADLERKAREKAGAGADKARRIMEVIERAGRDAQKEILNVPRARQLLAEIVRISTGEDMPVYTIRTWLEEWKLKKNAATSKATQMRYAASVRIFTDWLGERADKPLENLTVADFRQFRESLIEEGRSPKTAQHYVRDVGSALRSAVREGLLGHNPASGLDPLDTAESSIGRAPFTPSELGKLVAKSPSAEWQGVILLGAYAGLRLGDAAGLKWKSVDLAEGTIRLIPAKTRRKKRAICVPLHSELRAFFEKYPSSDDVDAPVFPKLARKSISGKTGLSMTFVQIMEDAKVSRGKSRTVEKESAGRTTHERGFHSLRHTYVSALANAEVAEDVRMKLAGHSNSDVHAIYTHHVVETLATAIGKIPGLRQGDE